MIRVTEISVISTAESALKKLKKEKIAVFRLKKQGAKLIFRVNDKDLRKVFAIFDKPCYNIKVEKKSRISALVSLATMRAGLIVGGAAFVAACFLANSMVLKIEVGGSGSYLEHEVKKIVCDEGAGEFKLFSALNVSKATGRILSLPQVTFCNIEKRGSVLMVDVRTDDEHYGTVSGKGLVSDRAGIVKNLVAVCGTAAVGVGDRVEKGDALIYAYNLSEDEKRDCIAVGFALLECAGRAEYFAEKESEENLKNAYASAILDDEEIISRTHTVSPVEGGVLYKIEYVYLHKISINLS